MNTKEQKAAFFALYWGQKVLMLNGEPDKTPNSLLDVKRWIDSTINYPDSYLQLKSLENISDEDAIEVCKILIGNYTIKERYFDAYRQSVVFIFDRWYLMFNLGKYDYIVKVSTKADKEKNVVDNSNMICHATDYLRSRGYALPYLNYSVQDLINLKWIKQI